MLRMIETLKHSRKIVVTNKSVGYDVSCAGLEIDNDFIRTMKENARFEITSSVIRVGGKGRNNVAMISITTIGSRIVMFCDRAFTKKSRPISWPGHCIVKSFWFIPFFFRRQTGDFAAKATSVI